MAEPLTTPAGIDGSTLPGPYGVGRYADGARVVVAGGLDYYAGSRTSSPSFQFAMSALRVAGEGDCWPSSTVCAADTGDWTSRRERAVLAAELERLAQPRLAGVQALDDRLQPRGRGLVAA